MFLNRIKICFVSLIAGLINHVCRSLSIRKVFCVCPFHSNAISRSLSKHVSQSVPRDLGMPENWGQTWQHVFNVPHCTYTKRAPVWGILFLTSREPTGGSGFLSAAELGSKIIFFLSCKNSKYVKLCLLERGYIYQLYIFHFYFNLELFT